MRRRAVLVVEYDREDGHPISPDVYEGAVENYHYGTRKVQVEVQEDKAW